tara:strand:+ start:399 stop:752 length:354 start_codon:yes stop_codon:yes gene_type:complete
MAQLEYTDHDLDYIYADDERHGAFIKRKERELKVEKKPKEDIVENPSHYAKWSIQPISFIMRNGFEYWRGNIVKYATRAGFKTYDDMSVSESEIVDLQKVIRYAEMRINQLKGRVEL